MYSWSAYCLRYWIVSHGVGLFELFGAVPPWGILSVDETRCKVRGFCLLWPKGSFVPVD